MKMVYVASVVGKSCNLVLILGTQWGLSSLLIVGDCLNSSRKKMWLLDSLLYCKKYFSLCNQGYNFWCQ
jgi:hypothetical protein